MGAVCCRPQNILEDVHDEEQLTSSPTKYLTLERAHLSAPVQESDDDDDDEQIWEDASETLQTLDLEVILAEWQRTHLDGGLSVQELEVVQATHGHLVPAVIEDVATDGLSLFPSKVSKVHAVTDESMVTQILIDSLDARGLQLLKEAELACEDSKILTAFVCLQRLAAHINVPLCRLPAPADQIIKQVNGVLEALDCLADESDWLLSSEGALRVLYRHERGTTKHSLKFSATFDHPIAHILSLAFEWDLLTTWNKFAIDTLKLAEPSIFESFVYGAQWLPPGIKDAHAFVHAKAYDLADEQRCLLIMLQDFEIQDLPVEAQEMLPSAKLSKRRRVNLMGPSCIRLRPVAKDKTECSLMVHIDPHIRMVPTSLVNFVLGVLAPYVYRQMAETLDSQFSNSEKQYPKRIATRPDVYQRLETRMEAFFT